MSTSGRPDLASVAALFADPTRARIVTALLDGRSLPASVIASEGGVSASTTSGHLGRLVDGGVLSVERSGRHRYYRLAGPDVAAAVEALAAIAPQPPVRSLREATRAEAMRRARTCYDHLAGRWGVAVMHGLVATGALVRCDGGQGIDRVPGDRLAGPIGHTPYVLGPCAHEVFGRVSVPMDALLDRPRTARPLLRFCLDWSEQRHHLAGALGAALLTAFVDAGWIAPRPGGRTVQVTDAGAEGLRSTLGVDGPDVVAAAS